MLPNRRTVKIPVLIAGSALKLTATLNSATRWTREGPAAPAPASSPSSEPSLSFRAGGGGAGGGVGSRGGWGTGRGSGGEGTRGGELWRGERGGGDQIGLLSQSGTDLRLGVAPSAMTPAPAAVVGFRSWEEVGGNGGGWRLGLAVRDRRGRVVGRSQDRKTAGFRQTRVGTQRFLAVFYFKIYLINQLIFLVFLKLVQSYLVTSPEYKPLPWYALIRSLKSYVKT
jgi:hypothetical protein